MHNSRLILPFSGGNSVAFDDAMSGAIFESGGIMPRTPWCFLSSINVKSPHSQGIRNSWIRYKLKSPERRDLMGADLLPRRHASGTCLLVYLCNSRLKKGRAFMSIQTRMINATFKVLNCWSSPKAQGNLWSCQQVVEPEASSIATGHSFRHF